jgi:transposase
VKRKSREDNFENMTKKEIIFALYNQGMSYRQIKEQTGFSKGTISYHLGEGVKERAMDRRKQDRHKITTYIREEKVGKVCMDCREDYPHWILEFDHRPGEEKKFTIGTHNITRDKSLDEVKAEIAKCDIVCANCHKNRTYWRKLKNGVYPATKELYD